jgi:hypothetical protein
MKRIVLGAIALALLLGRAEAATKKYIVTVSAGKYDRRNTPVIVQVDLPVALAKARGVTLIGPNGKKIPGQVTEIGLMGKPVKKKNRRTLPREIHFILPSLKAGVSTTFTMTVTTHDVAMDQFIWGQRVPGGLSILTFNGPIDSNGRPVLLYMNKAFDDSTKKRRAETFKVYHHLYDPEGKRLVTNGAGGLYPHHRGLFYGFKTIYYGGHKKPVDTWHCTGDTYQSHERFLSKEVGPVLGRHRVLIAWHGHKKEGFAKEERELTVYNIPGGRLVEFASRLRTTNGKVKLDGDPQHAGFQFRAAQEVAAKTSKQTYFLRPDGRDKSGATRNWPKDKKHVNLPWDAMSFVLGGQRYSVAYLDKPTNPKEARFSERNYGRFGSYFVYEVTKEKPLVIDYRIWLQKGEMTRKQVAALSADFVTPPVVKVK